MSFKLSDHQQKQNPNSSALPSEQTRDGKQDADQSTSLCTDGESRVSPTKRQLDKSEACETAGSDVAETAEPPSKLKKSDKKGIQTMAENAASEDTNGVRPRTVADEDIGVNHSNGLSVNGLAKPYQDPVDDEEDEVYEVDADEEDDEEDEEELDDEQYEDDTEDGYGTSKADNSAGKEDESSRDSVAIIDEDDDDSEAEDESNPGVIQCSGNTADSDSDDDEEECYDEEDGDGSDDE
ncbi:hypothetical protein GJ496_004473 [Pomphorhynchus laevis]|nr:hypothetical protein GJ496_004473 [Pomphorhynchus laevis]